MGEDLQYKLLNMEVTPPPGNWNEIVRRLNGEDNTVDEFPLRLAQAEIEPPPAVWSNLLTYLDAQNDNQHRPGRIIPVKFRRIAIAALIAGIISIPAVLFINGGYNKGLVSNTSMPITNALTDQNNIPLPVPDSGKGRPEKKNTSDKPTVSKIASNNLPKPERKSNKSKQPQAGSTYYEPHVPVSYAHLETAIEISTDEISVAAPLIRDKYGNVIMDVKLISSSDPKYITVTGPNGQQTKLSKKFLSFVRYLNGEIPPHELDIEGAEWKKKFEDWRSRLAQQVAFTPAAGNFLDIFELKELLQER